MKLPKGCLIPIVVIIVLIGVYYVSGLHTEYYFAESGSGNENIELVNDGNFRLTFGLASDKETKESNPSHISAAFILAGVNNDVTIDTSNILTFNAFEKPFELDSVYAIDGFYSWKKEMNSKAKAFHLLPETFRTVSKEIRAYFVYSWHFKTKGLNTDTVQVKVNTTIKSKNRTYRIKETYLFELKSRIYFRSPIRAH